MSGGIYTNIAKKRAEQNNTPSVASSQSASPAEKSVRQPSEKAPEPKLSTKPQSHLPTSNSPTHIGGEKPEKYTTHLEPSLIKKLKLYATEREMKDYQVVRDSLLLYFKSGK